MLGGWVSAGYAQTGAPATRFEIEKFQTTGGELYVEVNIAIDPSTLRFERESVAGQTGGGSYIRQARLGFACYALNDQEFDNPDSLLAFRASRTPAYSELFRTATPPVRDTLDPSLDLALLVQRRVQLRPGRYMAVLDVTDHHLDNGQVLTLTRTFELKAPDLKQPEFSDLILVQSVRYTGASAEEPFARNGFKIVPYLNNATYVNADTLSFYLEYYRLGNFVQDPLFAKVFVTEANSRTPVPGHVLLFKPRVQRAHEVLYGSLKIAELPSQTYFLHVEIRRNDGTVVGGMRRKFFVYNNRTEPQTNLLATNAPQAGNDFIPKDEDLKRFLPSLQYIASALEISMMKTLKTDVERRNFFVSFWEKRVNDPSASARTWSEYLNRIKYANQYFKMGNLEGWKSDRGRVLLTYGIPSDVQQFDGDTDKFPYAVWTYNKLGTQFGVIFAFVCYNTAFNDYQLVHSTRIGEVQNANWRQNIRPNPFDPNRLREFDLKNSAQQGFEYKDVVPQTSGGAR